MTEIDTRFPWNLPAARRRRNAVMGTAGYRRLRAVIALCRLLEDAADEAADEIEDDGVLSAYLPCPAHNARLLRSLATQAGVVADLVGGDLPAVRR